MGSLGKVTWGSMSSTDKKVSLHSLGVRLCCCVALNILNIDGIELNVSMHLLVSKKVNNPSWGPLNLVSHYSFSYSWLHYTGKF